MKVIEDPILYVHQSMSSLRSRVHESNRNERHMEPEIRDDGERSMGSYVSSIRLKREAHGR